MGYIYEPHPILRYPLEMINSCPVRLLLPYQKHRLICYLPLLLTVIAISTYATLMIYAVEVGTS